MCIISTGLWGFRKDENMFTVPFVVDIEGHMSDKSLQCICHFHNLGKWANDVMLCNLLICKKNNNKKTFVLKLIIKLKC